MKEVGERFRIGKYRFVAVENHGCEGCYFSSDFTNCDRDDFIDNVTFNHGQEYDHSEFFCIDREDGKSIVFHKIDDFTYGK